jgi:predicted Zn-dependent protease
VERHELRHIVELALDILAVETTVKAAEVYASWCEQQVVDIRHDTERPHDHIPVPQASDACGLSLRLILADGSGSRVGFGSDAGELSRDSIIAALEMARLSASAEPVQTLPRPLATAPVTMSFHDPDVLTLSTDAMMTLAEEALEGALATWTPAGRAAGAGSSLRLSGEIRCRNEIYVVGSTHGLLASDTSTALLATLYGYLPQDHSRGSSCQGAAHMQQFSPYDAGVEAVQRTLQARGGITLPDGVYPVVFGPQAVADLLQDLILPSLSLDTVAAHTSPFADQRGQLIASPLLTLTDDAHLPGLIGSHTISGEGLPTGTTRLIDSGRLVDFLADAYHAQLLEHRLGAIVPRNGMRYTTNGAGFAMRPGIFPTNVTVSSAESIALEALLAPITEGIYVGGLWYTMPQAGLRAGDFSSTVIGPSFHIRDGKLAQPLQPGTLRLQDNFLTLLQQMSAISTTRQPVVLSSRQSVVLAPEVRCPQAHFVA